MFGNNRTELAPGSCSQA